MHRASCSIVWIACLAGGARAEPPPALRALLARPDELAAWLRERDPLIDAQRARVDAARAAARQTRALPNPQLNLGASDLVIDWSTVAADASGRKRLVDVVPVEEGRHARAAAGLFRGEAGLVSG